ncbi:MAG: CDP-alcohol phosphatidyltransferase family protein [Myxococcota bacterium]|nr:CDP-alcohol phosphatidyltransferase family protein [Myxococcota bacterium]
MPWRTLANGLTALRALSVLPMVWCILEGFWWTASFVFALAVITDLLDGRVARRRQEVSRLGGVFDHAVDALFVSSGLAALSLRGLIPMMLPVLIVLAFAQYALDSRVLAGKALRTSFLGRNNGIAYYVVLGVSVVGQALAVSWPSPAEIRIGAWLVLASTVVSMSDRAVTFYFIRRARDSPSEGK